MKTKKPVSKKKLGMALGLVMILAIILVGFSAAVGLRARTELHQVKVRAMEKRAKYGAYAGVSRALDRLNTNPNWAGGFAATPLATDPSVQFNVRVVNNYGMPPTAVPPGSFAPDAKTWVPAGAVWLESIGRVAGSNFGVSGMVGVAANYRPKFDHAVFADNTVNVGNCTIDTYNSDPNQPVPAPNGAAVASNGFGGGTPHVIMAGAVIDGDVYSGVNSDPNDPTIIQGAGTYGEKKALDETHKLLPFPPRPVGIPDLEVNVVGTGTGTDLTTAVHLGPGTYRNVVVSQGARLVLAGGEYNFTGDFTLDGGTIEVNTMTTPASEEHPTVIYVDGDISITNQSVLGEVFDLDLTNVDPCAPKLLQVYCTSTSAAPATKTMVIDNSTVHAIIAGKTLDATVTGSTYDGGLLTRNAVLSDSTLRFDVRLEGVLMQGQGEMSLISISPMSKGATEALVAGAVAAPPAPGAAPPPPAPPPPPPPELPPAGPGPAGGPVTVPATAPAPYTG